MLARPESVTHDQAIERRIRTANAALMVVCLAILALGPLYLANQYYMRLAILICMFTAMSIGWNMIGGYANQISLGHAVFFGIGAYTSVLLELRHHVTPWLGIPAGMAVSAAVAVIVGFLTFRLSGHYFALATLALLQIANILFTYFKDITGGSSGLTVPIMGDNPGMFQFSSLNVYYYLSAAIMVVALLVSRCVLYSVLGYRLRAIKGNPNAAQLAGINLMRAKLTALVISSLIVGMVGGFYAQYTQYIDPNSTFTFDVSINMALFAIIGGVDSWWGPILGCLILVPLNQYTSLVLTGQWAPLGEAVYGLLLILVILLKPRGLAYWVKTGWKRLWAGRGARGSA